MAAAGGSPQRVAGPGDTAPGTGGTLGQITALGFNGFGEVVFRAAITGGTGGYGLFVGTVSSVRKVVANGDPNPAGGTFALTSTSGVNTSNLVKLNALGQVAFLDANSVFVSTPVTGITAVVTPSTTLPAPLDTRRVSSISAIGGFNDSAAVAFAAGLSGTEANNAAVLRAAPDSPVALVAYKGQSAPGTTGPAFNTFSRVVLNNAGDVAFYSTLLPSTPWGAVFKLPSGGNLTSVVLQGTPAPGGGTFRHVNYHRLMANGSVYFESTSSLASGAGLYGCYLATGSTVQALVTDQDALPEGSRLVLRTLFPRAAGTWASSRGARAATSACSCTTRWAAPRAGCSWTATSSRRLARR